MVLGGFDVLLVAPAHGQNPIAGTLTQAVARSGLRALPCAPLGDSLLAVTAPYCAPMEHDEPTRAEIVNIWMLEAALASMTPEQRAVFAWSLCKRVKAEKKREDLTDTEKAAVRLAEALLDNLAVSQTA